MLAVAAALLFVATFILAIGVIAAMIDSHGAKALDALLLRHKPRSLPAPGGDVRRPNIVRRGVAISPAPACGRRLAA